MTLRQAKVSSIYLEAAMKYNEQLNEHEKGISYLETRGFSLKFLNQHMIGFAPPNGERDWLWNTLVKENLVSPKHFLATNLGAINQESRMIVDYIGSQRIVFPLWVDGNIGGFSSRTILPNVQPRYKTLKSEDADLPLFNGDTVKYADERVYIAEGAIDALSLEYMGYPAVGIIGLSAFGKESADCFRGFGGEVVIVTDTDTNGSGQKARQKIANVLYATGITKVSYKEIPKASNEKSADVNGFMLKHGVHVAKMKFASIPNRECKYIKKNAKKYGRKSSNVSFDIASIVGRYTEVIQESAGRFRCKCPLHADSDPSCVLYGDTNMFKCFGCGAGGNSIRFLMLKENIDYAEAIGRASTFAN